ncbi:MAG: cupredoxin domain-containing protein [Deltaproteobacteria bacterium]|nr:cupredoxin domain-containing protein [Deltaproteobacteria bacterium]
MGYGRLLLLGAIAGFTIYLGFPIAVLAVRPRMRALFNSLSVGVLVFLLVEIAYKSLEMVEDSTKAAFSGGGVAGPVLFGAVLVAGLCIGLLGLTSFEERFIVPGKETDPAKRSRRLSMMIALGIGLHNFSEGLVIGQEYAAGAVSIAFLLIAGFAMHNAAEGFGIAAPLRPGKADWKFLALAGFIGGAPTFFGTIAGSFFVSEPLELFFLSLAAGSILYIIGELIHLGKLQGQHRTAMAGLLAGFFIAYGTDLFIEVGIEVQSSRRIASRTIAVEAAEYRFSPSSFVVKQGEVVRFTVNNAGKLPHEFELEALGVEALIPPGESVDVVVSADKPGRYAIICDLPGHLAAGMRDTLTVKPE